MIVYAPNVHTGGGKVLLDELLENEPFGKVSALFCDERYEVPQKFIQRKLPVFKVFPTLADRFRAEFKLKRYCGQNESESVLFFGNLPPLLFKPLQAILYLQNCFLLPKIPIISDSFKVRIRLRIERIILRLFYRNVSEIWVQSQWMVTEVKKMSANIKVEKKPIIPHLPILSNLPKAYDFITVSSLSKHKRFDFFLEALRLLDLNLKKPICVLAVLDSKDTVDIASIGLRNIRLEIRNTITREELYQNYARSRISVITSTLESFCLPVYESIHFGLKVLAPDRAYILDVKNEVIIFEDNLASNLATSMRTHIFD